MPRRAAPLTASRVKAAAPGRYCDGDGLYRDAQDNDRGWWTFSKRPVRAALLCRRCVCGDVVTLKCTVRSSLRRCRTARSRSSRGGNVAGAGGRKRSCGSSPRRMSLVRCVRAVAARHDVYPSLLHYWRRQVREGRLGMLAPAQIRAGPADRTGVAASADVSRHDRRAALQRRRSRSCCRTAARLRVGNAASVWRCCVAC